MDWIDKKANEFNEARTEKERHDNIIQLSNYWASLKEQIIADVGKIREHPIWSKVLGNSEIGFGHTDGNWQIQLLGYPLVFITIINNAETIILKKEIRKGPNQRTQHSSETLQVISDGARVYLQKNEETTFFVPEQASEYILEPIIEALSGTPSD